MKKMLIAVLALVLALAACGGGNDAGTEEETSTTTTAAPATTQATTTTSEATTTTTEAGTTSTQATETTMQSSGDPDVDAITVAVGIAFDSTADFEEKAGYIDDPGGLEETVATYMATGDSMGGVSVSVTDVTVNGDTADVMYDLLFNGNPVYPEQTTSAVLTDEGWKVPRDAFCTLMDLARSSCPVE
jgi:ABC-type glycerol-3-phosphate transport system substrate-binding protein